MTGLIDGIPLAESVRDAAAGVSDGTWLGAGAAAVGVAGAVGDVVADPVGAFFASGFGWVIEHNPILRSALDAVSGDPDAVDRVCESWKDGVAAPLAAVAGAVSRAGSSTSGGWSGEAAEAYRAATAVLAGHGEALATAARAAAAGLRAAETLVLEVRSFLRDELSKLLGWTAAGYAIAAAAAPSTAGASVAAFTNAAVLRGALLGRRFAEVLRRLAARLDEFSGRLARLGAAADALRRSAAAVDGAAAPAARLAGTGRASTRVFDTLVAKWDAATPSAPGAGDLAKAAGTAGVKAAGDAWKTWSGTEEARPA